MSLQLEVVDQQKHEARARPEAPAPDVEQLASAAPASREQARQLRRVASNECWSLEAESQFCLPGPPALSELQRDVADWHACHLAIYEGTHVYSLLESLHARLPKANLKGYLRSVRAFISVAKNKEHELTMGDGCSGTGIQHLFWSAAVVFWSERYGVEKVKPTYVVAAESEPAKQSFLSFQHSPGTILKDVGELSQKRWHDVSGSPPTKAKQSQTSKATSTTNKTCPGEALRCAGRWLLVHQHLEAEQRQR